MNSEAERQVRAAADALKAGNGREARRLIEPLARSNANHAQLWMMLGESARLTGEMALLEEAAVRVLAIEPRAVRAYGWRGDVAARSGDVRAAARHYREGLSVAASLQPLPAGLDSEVTRQQGELARLDAAFASMLRDGFQQRGIFPADVSLRFAESMALLDGTARLHLQQPAIYYFPGLPQRAWYERDEFEWAGRIEASTDIIRAELLDAMDDPDLFRPYIDHDPNQPTRDVHGMAGNDDWSSLHIIDNGQISSRNAARFPATLAALEAAPLCRIGVRAPTVMFSLLKAGAHIPPHHGMINCRLICHLPLVVPGPGMLRVGNRALQWEVGKLLIFDDSIEHEARNDSTEDRIVLIFDIWRPELTMSERNAVVGLFDVIDSPTQADGISRVPSI